MTDQWQAGKTYPPGSLVIPTGNGAQVQTALNNPDFESGTTGWDFPAGWSIVTDKNYQGTASAKYIGNGTSSLTNTQSKAPPWAPDQTKALGDVVQPTVPNGWEYVVTQITGAATTGDNEPAWPTADGAMVFETPDSTSVPSTINTNADGKTAAQVGLDQLIKDRYNLGDDQ